MARWRKRVHPHELRGERQRTGRTRQRLFRRRTAASCRKQQDYTARYAPIFHCLTLRVLE